MLLCCPTGFLRSPISQISITELKRMNQGSFMLLINLQNKTCYDSFCTCGQHRGGITCISAALSNKYCFWLCFGKKLYLDLTVKLMLFKLSERRRGMTRDRKAKDESKWSEMTEEKKDYWEMGKLCYMKRGGFLDLQGELLFLSTPPLFLCTHLIWHICEA